MNRVAKNAGKQPNSKWHDDQRTTDTQAAEFAQVVLQSGTSGFNPLFGYNVVLYKGSSYPESWSPLTHNFHDGKKKKLSKHQPGNWKNLATTHFASQLSGRQSAGWLGMWPLGGWRPQHVRVFDLDFHYMDLSALRIMLHVYSSRCPPISFAGWAPSLPPLFHSSFHYLLRHKLADFNCQTSWVDETRIYRWLVLHEELVIEIPNYPWPKGQEAEPPCPQGEVRGSCFIDLGVMVGQESCCQGQ